jgi:hypothetical protein
MCSLHFQNFQLTMKLHVLSVNSMASRQKLLRSGIHTVVWIKITVVRDVTSCICVYWYQRFEGTCCLHLRSRKCKWDLIYLNLLHLVLMLIINEHFYPDYDALLSTESTWSLTTTSWLNGANLNIATNYLCIMRHWAGTWAAIVMGKV